MTVYIKADGIDANGQEITLDADADTSITADTDDQIDIEIAGADDFRFTANTFTVLAGSSIVIAGSLDINGVADALILDADGDTTISAPTDDQIDIEVAGADDFKIKANSFELQDGSDINQATATNEHVLFCSRNTVAYTDTTNKTLFVLPANAVIVDVICHVTTAFNDSGADSLDVGTTVADPDEYVDALDCANVGVNRCGDAADMPATARGSVGGSSVTVLGKYTGANADATAGAATVEIIWTVA